MLVTVVISVKVLLLGRSDAVVIHIYSNLLAIATRLATGVNHELDGGDLGLFVMNWSPHIHLLFISLIEVTGVVRFALVILPIFGMRASSIQMLLRWQSE